VRGDTCGKNINLHIFSVCNKLSCVLVNKTRLAKVRTDAYALKKANKDAGDLAEHLAKKALHDALTARIIRELTDAQAARAVAWVCGTQTEEQVQIHSKSLTYPTTP
jgi:hypothetical protein